MLALGTRAFSSSIVGGSLPIKDNGTTSLDNTRPNAAIRQNRKCSISNVIGFHRGYFFGSMAISRCFACHS
jgi:hypothetical protein